MNCFLGGPSRRWLCVGGGVHLIRSVRFGVPVLFVLLLLMSLRLVKTCFVHRLRAGVVDGFSDRVDLGTNFLRGALRPVLVTSSARGLRRSMRAVLDSFANTGVLRARIVSRRNCVLKVGSRALRSLVKAGSASQSIRRIVLLSTPSSCRCIGRSAGDHILGGVDPVCSVSGANALVNILIVRSGVRSICSRVDRAIDVFLGTSIITVVVAVILTIVVSQKVAHPVSRVHQRATGVTSKSCSNGIAICKTSRLNRLTRAVGSLSCGMGSTRRAARSRHRELSDILQRVASNILTASHHNGVVVVGDQTVSLLSVSRSGTVKRSVVGILGLNRGFAFHRLLRARSRLVLGVPASSRSAVLHKRFSIVRQRSKFVDKLIYILSSVARRRGIRRRHHDFISGISRRLQAPLADIGDCARSLVSNT